METPTLEKTPIVIQAGGRGTRMNGFSDVFPKPLIPIRKKALIEVVLDKFFAQGYRKFYIIINYLAPFIESYFRSISHGYDIEFVTEQNYLGTAGGLTLLPHLESKHLVLTNCDILIDANYREIVNFHVTNKSDLTIVSTDNVLRSPYGNILADDKGRIARIEEKPSFNLLINTGFYIINKNMIDYIEKGLIDMPDFINLLLNNNRTVMTYKIPPNNYTDIGTLKHYKEFMERLDD